MLNLFVWLENNAGRYLLRWSEHWQRSSHVSLTLLGLSHPWRHFSSAAPFPNCEDISSAETVQINRGAHQTVQIYIKFAHVFTVSFKNWERRLFFSGRAVMAAKAIFPVLFVLGMWIGIFAMVGMQIFRCDLLNESLCMVIRSTLFGWISAKGARPCLIAIILCLQVSNYTITECPQYCSNKIGSGTNVKCVFTEDQVKSCNLFMYRRF